MVGEEGEVRREMVLVVERANLEIRKNLFAIRAGKDWNKLPEEVKNQTSINAFKNAYDRWTKKKLRQMAPIHMTE